MIIIHSTKTLHFTSDKPHYEQVPFEVPNGWCWTTIEEICSKIGSGSTPKGSNYSKEGIPFFRSQNVQNFGLVLSDIKYISDKVHQSMKGTEVVANDLLLNITGGSLGRCAVVPSDFEIGNVSQHVCILRTILVNPEYLHSFILSSFFAKSMKITGSGREGLPKYNLEKMLLPLPPIQEQERIIIEAKRLQNYLDKIDTCSGNLAELISHTKSKILDLAIHGKLVPQDPTDEPATELLKRINPKAEITCDNGHYQKLPEGWCFVSVGNYVNLVTDFVASGSFASLRENVQYYNSPEYAILVRTKDFQNNFQKELVYTDKHGYDFLEKSNLHGGELVFSNVGSIGKVFIVPHLKQKMTLAPNAIMVRFHHDEHQKWFYYLFQSSIGLDLLHSITSATAIGKFNKTDFKKLVIPIPPLSEQHRIVAKIEELFSQLDKIEASL